MDYSKEGTLYLRKKKVYLEEVSSTNDYLMNQLQSQTGKNGNEVNQNSGDLGLIEGETVFTFFQTAGKGQRGSIWENGKKENIALSFLLKPDLTIPLFWWTAATALAAVNFTKKVCFENITDQSAASEEVKVKWPNDIYSGDLKLGGILSESVFKGSHLEGLVIGLGLNVNSSPKEKYQAISLSEIKGQNFHLEKMIDPLLEEIETEIGMVKHQFAHFKDRFLNTLYKFNIKSWYSSGKAPFIGRIIDVETNGHLLIETEEGVKVYGNKEIVFVS